VSELSLPSNDVAVVHAHLSLYFMSKSTSGPITLLEPLVVVIKTIYILNMF